MVMLEGSQKEGGRSMSVRRGTTGGDEPLRQDIDVTVMLTVLRCWLRLPVQEEVSGERAAGRGRQFPSTVEKVDIVAWFAWSVAGLRLFAGDSEPQLDRVVNEARRVLLALLMERTEGNITHVAARIGSSRRVVRERLKEYCLYGLVDWNEGDGVG